jgi:DNA repair and recombination protein RAD54 and RAD54-like protein
MVRSVRRARASAGESAAAAEHPASSSSSRAHRSRGEEPVVVIDLGGDDDDRSGGEAAVGAASGRGESKAAASPMMVPAGAVAMRTRSRRRAMQAAVAAEDATPRSKRRKGASADAAEASGSGGRKPSAAPRSASKERRRVPPSSRGRTRERTGKDSPVPAKKKAPARGKQVKTTSQADESVEDDGRGDDASSEENDKPRTVVSNGGIDRGNGVRRGATSGDKIKKHGGVSALNLNPGGNKAVSGAAEGVGSDGGGRAQRVVGSNVCNDRGDRELFPVMDIKGEETAMFEEDYDDEMLEGQLVGGFIRAYSNGGDLDPDDGSDWEAEDEMEFTDGDDDDGDFVDDADETGMSEPVHDHSKVLMQNALDQKIVLGGVVSQEEDEADLKDQTEPKRVGAPGSSQIEVLDSDEEVKVLDDISSAPTRKASAQSHLPVVSSCVAWRTRSSWGINQDRHSYNTYFEALSDEPKEDDDDTEVELDDEDDGNDEDGSSDSYANDDEEEEEEAEENEEAERRKLKNPIDASDDEMMDNIVSTSKVDFEWEEYEDPDPHIYRPFMYKKGGSGYPVGSDTLTEQQKRSRFNGSGYPVGSDTLTGQQKRSQFIGSGYPLGSDTLTEQQKRSRFTWELERRKKLKLGITTHRLYERDLDSDSSGSDKIKRYGFQKVDSCKVGSKKRHPSSQSGKRSGHATALKRQSLMKLLMDKMSGDKNGESLTFDQNPQLKFSFKEMHPLVFSFGDEDPIPADKSKQDVALDMLWADFDFALESENIGTYYDDEVYLLQYDYSLLCTVFLFIIYALMYGL